MLWFAGGGKGILGSSSTTSDGGTVNRPVVSTIGGACFPRPAEAFFLDFTCLTVAGAEADADLFEAVSLSFVAGRGPFIVTVGMAVEFGTTTGVTERKFHGVQEQG